MIYAEAGMDVAKGWNGNLLISAEGVTISRGLKGLLTRKRIDRKRPKMIWSDIKGVRFLPATRLVGYVQFVTAQEPATLDYLSTIRDDRTVTFTKRHTKEFMKAAGEIAELSGVEVETVADKPDYWATVNKAAPRPVSLHRIPLPQPIEWGSCGDDKPSDRPQE